MAETTASCYTSNPTGGVLRPMVSEGYLKMLTKRLYGLDVIDIQELNSYIDRNYHVTVKDEHNNPFIKSVNPHGYVLKVLNYIDSKQPKYIDAVHDFISYSNNQGIPASIPVSTVLGKLKQLEVVPESNPGSSEETRTHLIRLFTYIPGIILQKVPYTPRLCFNVGSFIGNLDRKIKMFENSFFANHSRMWSLGNVETFGKFASAVTNEKDRGMVEDIITKFKEEVIPCYGKFQKAMIHGDCNEQNIIVQPLTHNGGKILTGSDDYEVSGIVDFNDAALSYYIFEVSIAMCYLMVESKVIDPLDAAGHVLAGYISEMPLNDVEMDALKLCVSARFCQSLVMGAHTYSLDPSNVYVLETAKRGWPCLRELWASSNDQIKTRWNNIITAYED